MSLTIYYFQNIGVLSEPTKDSFNHKELKAEINQASKTKQLSQNQSNESQQVIHRITSTITKHKVEGT